jgi:hypothetical protein
MASLKGKHNIVEIEGVRCSLVESGMSAERMAFLKELLAFNRYTVKTESEKAKDGSVLNTFVIGVTDVLFNPVIVLYQKKLFKPNGDVINPAFWYQWPESDSIPYWQVNI